MTAATIADLIREGRRSTLAGRNSELRALRQVTAPGGPVVAYVHGPAGIGKTALISALDACLEDEGVSVDCIFRRAQWNPPRRQSYRRLVGSLTTRPVPSPSL
jgi:MoxR-like ATPase